MGTCSETFRSLVMVLGGCSMFYTKRIVLVLNFRLQPYSYLEAVFAG